MVIYGEYLFLENFVTSGLLILLTAKLSGCRPIKWRWLLSSLLGGIFGFTILLPVTGVISVAIRGTVVIIMTVAAFGTKDILRSTMLFLALTFLSGGAAMAFLLWQQTPAISANGALYVQPWTYGKLLLWGGAALGGAFLFVRLVRGIRIENITKGEVCLSIDGEVFSFEALVDSGNSLKEPLTNRPVMLIDRKGSAKLPFDKSPEKATWLKTRMTLIPYKAVGTEKGCLRGFRTDDIRFEGKPVGSAVVAFYDGDFGEFEMLLNREVLNEIT